MDRFFFSRFGNFSDMILLKFLCSYHAIILLLCPWLADLVFKKKTPKIYYSMIHSFTFLIWSLSLSQISNPSTWSSGTDNLSSLWSILLGRPSIGLFLWLIELLHPSFWQFLVYLIIEFYIYTLYWGPYLIQLCCLGNNLAVFWDILNLFEHTSNHCFEFFVWKFI